MATPVGNTTRTSVTGGEVCQRNACLSALSSHSLSLLKPYLTEKVIREGSILWDAKQLATDVYFPASGLISIVLPMSEGSSVEVGSICKEAAATAGFNPEQIEFHTRGVVLIGGTFIRVPTSRLFFAAKESSEIENLVAFCRDWILIQAQQEAGCNAVHSADKRFCRWLFQACERMETDTLSLTQEMIASVLGIRRTTVTLSAQTLPAAGVLHYRRGKISVLNQARLRSTACECCNSLVRRHWPSTRLLAATIASGPQS